MDAIITHTVLLLLVALLQFFNLFLGFACLPLSDYRLGKKKGEHQPFWGLFKKHLYQALYDNQKETSEVGVSSVKLAVVLFVHFGAFLFLLVAFLPPKEGKWSGVGKVRK